jgi:hypothetical protein
MTPDARKIFTDDEDFAPLVLGGDVSIPLLHFALYRLYQDSENQLHHTSKAERLSGLRIMSALLDAGASPLSPALLCKFLKSRLAPRSGYLLAKSGTSALQFAITLKAAGAMSSPPNTAICVQRNMERAIVSW